MKRSDILELTSTTEYHPSVSIILPFNARIALQKELHHDLKAVTDQVEKKLFDKYPTELAETVLGKLKKIIQQLEIDNGKSGIAIFVSPLFEKVLYLDVPLAKKVKIDDTFEVRDLVYANNQSFQYLLLVLSGDTSDIYHGRMNSIEKLDAGLPQSVEEFKNDIAERTVNFSDIYDRKEVLMEKFLHHVDLSLHNVLQHYRLPVFVLGTARIVGHFKQLTKHEASIKGYQQGHFVDADDQQLREAMQPFMEQWKKEKQEALLQMLHDAAGQKKLAEGIKDVWREAINRNCRFLVVEKNFTYAAWQGSNESVIGNANELMGDSGKIKDAVDETIEKVLQNGGEVEFVDDGSMKEFRHIALVKFY